MACIRASPPVSSGVYQVGHGTSLTNLAVTCQKSLFILAATLQKWFFWQGWHTVVIRLSPVASKQQSEQATRWRDGLVVVVVACRWC